MSDSSEERLQAVIAAARARRLVRKMAAESSVGGGNTEGSLPISRVQGEHRPSDIPAHDVVCLGAPWETDRDSTSPPTEPSGLAHDLDSKRHGPTDSKADPWPWLAAQKHRTCDINEVLPLSGQLCDEDKVEQRHACRLVSDMVVTTVGQGLEINQLGATTDEDVPKRMEPEDQVGIRHVVLINTHCCSHARTHTRTRTNTHHTKYPETTVEQQTQR